MSEASPVVEVQLRHATPLALFENCEAYQNHATGLLVIISLQSGARQQVFEQGQWSHARILYRDECVSVLQAGPKPVDATAQASQLGWTSDGFTWPIAFGRAGDSLTDEVGRYRQSKLIHDDEGREIAYADYVAEDGSGKTLRVFNA